VTSLMALASSNSDINCIEWNCMENDARPEVLLRKWVEYPRSSDSGTNAETTWKEKLTIEMDHKKFKKKLSKNSPWLCFIFRLY